MLAVAAAAYEVVFMNHPKFHYVLNFVLGENYYLIGFISQADCDF